MKATWVASTVSAGRCPAVRCGSTGNAGDYLGCGMQDGTLRVNGNAGDFAAAALAGGKVVIGGNAGDSPPPRCRATWTVCAAARS
ncbi:hypothetical protein ACU4GD_09635 [Cupriavidus basilensis]